jgi:hypothetical protein
MDTSHDSSLQVDEQRMLVIFNQVRADRRDDFISFVNDVLCPAAASIQPVSLCNTRLLEPHVGNADGTYTYVVLIEPGFDDTDTPVQAILSQVYGADASRAHLERYHSSLSDPNPRALLAEKAEIESQL